MAVDHNDVQDWTNMLNDNLKDVGGVLQSKSRPDAGAWRVGVFDCFNPIDLCLTTWCLPCITFGKTHHRTRKDPSMAGYSPVNTSCLLLCGSSVFGLSWIPLAMQRAAIRQKYNLQGSCLGDLLLSCCCGCCTLVQQEKETEALEEQRVDSKKGYAQEERMEYTNK